MGGDARAAFLTYLNQEGLANIGAWLNLNFGTHIDVPEYSGRHLRGDHRASSCSSGRRASCRARARSASYELGVHDEYLYDVETHDKSLYVEPSEA